MALQVPSSKFERELNPGSIKGAMKQGAGTEKTGLWLVPVEAVRRLDGFNVRVATPDYEAHIEELAASMIANGFYPDKPIAGYIAKEGDENVIYITDGYSRMSAVDIAREKGAEIDKVPVIVKPQTENIEDLTVALVQANEGRPLTPYEKSIVVKRLIGYNMEKPEIGRRLNMTERYVLDLEVLAGAPSKVRNLVITGKVSATEAIKQLRKNPAKAADKLADAVKAAEAQGKTRATAKHTGDGEEGEGEDRQILTAERKVTGSKQTDKLVWRLKGGEKIAKESLEPILKLAEGGWWRDAEDLDDAKDGEIVITETIVIDVRITRAVDENATDSGQAPSEDEIDDTLSDDGGAEKDEEAEQDDDAETPAVEGAAEGEAGEPADL